MPRGQPFREGRCTSCVAGGHFILRSISNLPPSANLPKLEQSSGDSSPLTVILAS